MMRAQKKKIKEPYTYMYKSLVGAVTHVYSILPTPRVFRIHFGLYSGRDAGNDRERRDADVKSRPRGGNIPGARRRLFTVYKSPSAGASVRVCASFVKLRSRAQTFSDFIDQSGEVSHNCLFIYIFYKICFISVLTNNKNQGFFLTDC